MENTLLQHKSWNHEILLKLNTKLTFEFIWFLFEKKLKIVQNYVLMNLKKQFIHPSISPTNHPINFTKKK